MTAWASHERERPLDDVPQNPIGYAFVVLGQVSLGEAIVGIQDPIGMREANSSDCDFGICAFRGGTRRLRLGRCLTIPAGFTRTFRGRLRHFADDLLRGFIFAQTLERWMPQAA